MRFPPHAAVSHVAQQPLLPPGAFQKSSLPPSSPVRYPSKACSGFLLCLKVLSSDPFTMFQLNKISCRTFDLTEQKWFRSSYQHSTTLDRLHISWGILKHVCPCGLRAIVLSIIIRHSLIMLSSLAELDLSLETFWLLTTWPGCLRYIKLWNSKICNENTLRIH